MVGTWTIRSSDFHPVAGALFKPIRAFRWPPKMNQVPPSNEENSAPSGVLISTKRREGSYSKGIACIPRKAVQEIMIGSRMPANHKRNRSPWCTQGIRSSAIGNLGATPYNNRFDRNWCGRHALCGGSKEVGLSAKVAPVPLRSRTFRSASSGPHQSAQSSVIRTKRRVGSG